MMYKQAMADLHNYVFVWYATTHIRGQKIRLGQICTESATSAEQYPCHHYFLSQICLQVQVNMYHHRYCILTTVSQYVSYRVTGIMLHP